MFGGILPQKWGIVVKNETNDALNASGHAHTYVGIHADTVV